VDRRVAASAQNQALAAILFPYKYGLDRDPGWVEPVVRAKRPAVVTRPADPAGDQQPIGRACDVSWIRCRSMP